MWPSGLTALCSLSEYLFHCNLRRHGRDVCARDDARASLFNGRFGSIDDFEPLQAPVGWGVFLRGRVDEHRCVTSLHQITLNMICVSECAATPHACTRQQQCRTRAGDCATVRVHGHCALQCTRRHVARGRSSWIGDHGMQLTWTKQSWKWMRRTPAAEAARLFSAEFTAEVMTVSALGQLVL